MGKLQKLGSLLLLGALLSTTTYASTNSTSLRLKNSTQTVIDNATQRSLKSQIKTSPAFAPILAAAQEELHKIIDKVAPSVVTILTYKEVKVVQPVIPPGFDEFRRWLPPDLRNFLPFFGQPKVKKERALGSGFIFKVDKDWVYILTNNHVVSNEDCLNFL